MTKYWVTFPIASPQPNYWGEHVPLVPRGFGAYGQRLAKFEVAGFIYYGNMKEFVFKNLDKPKWGNPLFFGGTDFTVGFADPMFPIQSTTFVEV